MHSLTSVHAHLDRTGLESIVFFRNKCNHTVIVYPYSSTQRKCQTSKDNVDNCRNMFETKISTGTKEKLHFSEKLGARISSWSYDMEGHAKKCVERYCELANRTTQQLYKVATPCLDDHRFEEEEMGSVGELPKVCLSICSEMPVFGTHW